MAEAVKRIGAVDQVIEYIKIAVRNGEYKVGDRLPNEADLANQIGVGRSSLREGMRILAAYGIVDIQQGGGTFIVNKTAERFFDILGYMPTSSLDDLMELRLIVEVGAIITVYDKLSEEDLKKLQEYVDRLDFKNGYEACAWADRSFHKRILDATRNPLLIPVEEMIFQARKKVLYQSFCDENFVNSARVGHQQILDSLKERNRTKCFEAMALHLDRTQKKIFHLWDNTEK